MLNDLFIDLLIQIFAEGEDDEVEPTEDDEVEVVDEGEEEVDEDNDSGAEDDEEVEFDDSEEEEEPKKEEVKEDKPQNEKERKSKNYNAAKERIEARKKKELEQAKRQSYIEGVKKSTGGINRFTNEKIVDEIDVQIFETMCEMEEQGLDPVEDYHKYAAKIERQRRQQEAQALASKEAEQKKIDEEMHDFVESYGQDTVKKILDDEAFAEFSEDLLGNIPIKKIYERFLKYNAKSEAKAEKLALEKDARRKASSGALGKKEKAVKSFQDMTPEEFHKWSLDIARRY